MALYCGIDLHSTSSQIAVTDQSHLVVAERKLRNEIGPILDFLEPYRQELMGIAVESTYNWYWLVDALTEAGYRVHLVNTAAAKQYEG